MKLCYERIQCGSTRLTTVHKLNLEYLIQNLTLNTLYFNIFIHCILIPFLEITSINVVINHKREFRIKVYDECSNNRNLIVKPTRRYQLKHVSNI